MFRFLLDILFPQKQRVRELEAMDPSAFAVKVPKTLARAGPGMMSLFDYRDPMIRDAIWELKYRGNKRVATLLATVMYDELLAFLEEYAPLTNFTEPLLIPIPLSKQRERERGFNQSKLLTDVLCKLDSDRNFTYSPALTKARHTPSQTRTTGRAERQKNLRGCFVANSLVTSRNIILIDDVATTGATLLEAKRALRGAGARRVIAFTVAH